MQNVNISNEVFVIHPCIFFFPFFENGVTTHSAKTHWTVTAYNEKIIKEWKSLTHLKQNKHFTPLHPRFGGKYFHYPDFPETDQQAKGLNVIKSQTKIAHLHFFPFEVLFKRGRVVTDS